MRALYLKIFLWFWAAMIALTLAVAWSARQVAELAGAPAPGEMRIALGAARTHHTLEAVLSRAGPEALARAIDRLPPPIRARILVLGPDGRELRGRETGAVLAGPHFAFPLGPGRDGEGEGDRYRMVVPLMLPGSDASPLLPRHRPGAHLPGLHPLTHGPASVAWTRLAVAVLVSGLVCWALALYLTRPLEGLRATARAIAQGALATPVDPRVLARGDEIGALARDIQRMVDRLRELLEGRTRLIRDLSHELRSPLARLQAALALAERRWGEEAPELARIAREAARLEALIGETLALARLEGGAGAPGHQEPVDMGALVEQVVGDARLEADTLGVRLSLELAPRPAGRPLEVRGDPALLSRAIDNVVRNACHHAGPGTVRVGVGGPGPVRIRVEDSGPGVPDGALQRIFDPFFQVDEARTPAGRGYGLGLAIARDIVTRHRGSIRAMNRPEGGLAIEIELPPFNAPGEARGRATEQGSAPGDTR